MPNRADEIVVVGLCGSLSEGSATRSALVIALQGAREAGARTTLIDLREWALPFYGQNGDFPDVARLKETVGGAQGLIWATPEYHGSFSGVLKNALDLLSEEHIAGKMVGLLGVAGGSIGAINALSHLRTVARQLHAWALPQQASIPSSYRAFDSAGALKDADLDKRVRELGRDVARFAFLHAQTDSAFVKMWESARENAEV
jgi:NAD(P)H-dependent FMN reductase